MPSTIFGRADVRSQRCGVAAVEKVIVLATLAGMVTLSTLVFAKFTDYSQTIHDALAVDLPAASAKLGESLGSNHRNSGEQKSRENGVCLNSVYRWVGGISLPCVMLALAYLITRGRQPSKKAAEPTNSFQEVKKKLQPLLAPGNAFTKRQQTMAILLNRMTGDTFDDFKIGYLVSPKVTTVLPATPLDEVRKYFVDHHFRHLFVCDVEGNLQGIISARDLQRASSGYASDVMSSNIVTANPDQLISPTITLMMERRISCLPVLDKDRLLGIVTTTDLMIALQCTLQILHTLGGIQKPST
jgi:acetoin utilization protein AcuB